MAELAPARLARLLNIDADIEWTEPDVSLLLCRQLAAPLLPDLLIVPGADSARLESLVRNRRRGESFLQHMNAPDPELELLSAIKAFARHIKADPANPLHGDMAGIIYFGAIAAAIVNCRRRITTLPDDELRNGFQWALRQPAASDLISLITRALASITLSASASTF
jgi:hypothetical protein